MLARYSGSVAMSGLITAALLYWMQLAVQSDPGTTFRPHPIRIAGPLPIFDPPPPRPPREPVAPPEPQLTPPEGATVLDPLPTSSIPLTGPPALPRLTPGGPANPGPERRTGPWIGAGELIALARVEPVYPHRAEILGLEGRVLVEFTVAEDGSVRDVRVIESSDKVFDRAAVTAAARFRYQPRVVDAVPVAVPGVQAEFVFRLRN